MENKYLIGIDPGLSGAVAVVNGNDGRTIIHRIPTIRLKTKREYDVPGMVAILKEFSPWVRHVILERAGAMPRQGVVSTFRTGLGFGIWLGIITTLGIPYTVVHPAIWKRAMMNGLPKHKNASIVRVMQLLPGAQAKDHNEADAILLALYGQRIMPAGT